MSHGIHDYRAKLSQPGVRTGVVRSIRALQEAGTQRVRSLRDVFAQPLRGMGGPLSINLDLTVACNHGCVHCIDSEMINTNRSLGFDEVVRSLSVLRLAGLRSVILIGGGEPTLHPEFERAVEAIKLLGLQCAIVSNGSRGRRIEAIAHLLRPGDWVRLSLDAGSDDLFQRMHRPRGRHLGLEEICESAARVKRINADVSMGFSFIVSWAGASVMGNAIEDNVDEMAAAARLAKQHQFDYITFKPLLDRDELGAEKIDVPVRSLLRRSLPTEPVEVPGPARAASAELSERIGRAMAEAKLEASEGFAVVETINMRVLTDPARHANLRQQPKRCYMHLYRQVLTPWGTYGCPVYRGADHDRVGAPESYDDASSFLRARKATLELIETFDASAQCANVHCLYSSTNWWLEQLAEGGAGMLPDPSEARDLFL